MKMLALRYRGLVAPAAPQPEAAPPPVPPQAERDHPLAPIGIVAVQQKRRYSNAIRSGGHCCRCCGTGRSGSHRAVDLHRCEHGSGIRAATTRDRDRGATTAGSHKPGAGTGDSTGSQGRAGNAGIESPPGGCPRWRRVHGSRHQTGREQIRTACCRCSAQRRFQGHVADQLHVLDGERLLGSSQDGPIITRAGRREFDFVNSVIGYRVRREVDVRPGQITQSR